MNNYLAQKRGRREGGREGENLRPEDNGSLIRGTILCWQVLMTASRVGIPSHIHITSN